MGWKERIVWALDWIGRAQLVSLLGTGAVTALITRLLDAPPWVVFGFGIIGACMGLLGINVFQNYQLLQAKGGKSPQLLNVLGQPYQAKKKVAGLRSIAPNAIIGLILVISLYGAFLICLICRTPNHPKIWLMWQKPFWPRTPLHSLNR